MHDAAWTPCPCFHSTDIHAYACVVYAGPNVPSNGTTCATVLASGITGVRQASYKQTLDALGSQGMQGLHWQLCLLMYGSWIGLGKTQLESYHHGRRTLAGPESRYSCHGCDSPRGTKGCCCRPTWLAMCSWLALAYISDCCKRQHSSLQACATQQS